MRLPSLRNSAAVHPESGHGEAVGLSASGKCGPPSQVAGDESEIRAHSLEVDGAHGTAYLQGAERMLSGNPVAHSQGGGYDCGREAFEGLLESLREVYLQDLAQLPALTKENGSLREQLQQVNGHGKLVEKRSDQAKEELCSADLPEKEAFEACQLDDAAQERDSLVVLSSYSDTLADKLKAVRMPSMASSCRTEPEDYQRERSLTVAKTLKFKTFEMLEVWEEVELRQTTFNRMQCVSMAERMHSSFNDDDSEEAIILSYEGCLSLCISAPGSPYRLLWDFVGAAFIFYDLFTIPLQVFTIEDKAYITFSMVLDWTTLLFWTTNVFASLTVGYADRGLIVMEPLKILRNYLKVWFWVDLVVVVPDWIFTIAATNGGGKSGAGSSVKFLRILRLVRMVRLVRLFKLRKIMQEVNDQIDSEYLSIVASIVKMILVLLAINHFIACAWYGIGDSFKHKSGTTWIKAHGFEGDKWYYMYATAFHWSITQFTPSSMSVQPHNMTERSFAVFIVVFALVGFSYLVGGIISHIGQIRSMAEDSAKQFWNLRRYLRQNSVPLELSIRIQRYLEHAWQRKQATLQTSDIKIFSMLSDQLQSELKCALALPHLFVHPLFERLEKVSFVTSHRLANAAIEHTLLAIDDSLFIPGEIAHYMYVVVKGRLQYFRFDSNGEEHKEWVDKAEDWIAEPVLWTTGWVHLGLLTACKEADLLTVHGKKFVDCVTRNPQASQFLSHYAHNFLAWLNSEHRDGLSDISQGEVISPLVIQFMEQEPYHEEMNHLNEGPIVRSRSDPYEFRRDVNGEGGAQGNVLSRSSDSVLSAAQDNVTGRLTATPQSITSKPAPEKKSSTPLFLPSQIPSPPSSPPAHLAGTPAAPTDKPVVMMSPNGCEAAPEHLT